MKFLRFFSLLGLLGITLAAFRPASEDVERIMVFKFFYDAASDKLMATEKMEVSRSLVERAMDGKIISVSKESIVSEMRFSARSIRQLAGGLRNEETERYGLVAWKADASAEKASDMVSDDKLLEYLKYSYRAFAHHELRGGVSDAKSFHCSGGECTDRVPPGVDVFVWAAE